VTLSSDVHISFFTLLYTYARYNKVGKTQRTEHRRAGNIRGTQRRGHMRAGLKRAGHMQQDKDERVLVGQETGGEATGQTEITYSEEQGKASEKAARQDKGDKT
jgi:hypothetical protein